MKKVWFSLLVAAAMTFTVSALACPADGDGAKSATTEKSGKALCGACGQVKGSDLCCKADAEKCGKCGLTKGSPGCCKLPKAG